VQTPQQRVDFAKFQAVMRTELDAAAAVNADIYIGLFIAAHRVNRTGSYALSAPDALLLANDDPAAGPLTEGAGRTDFSTWCGIAGQTDPGNKTGGETAGGVNTNPRVRPGKLLVNEPCTGKRAGVAADAALHSGGC